jgi:hypothetical protein
MMFVEHQFNSNLSRENIKRLNYIYNKYSVDRRITPLEFANKINEAYYRFSSHLYANGNETGLQSFFKKSFKSINAGSDIVDVGAGTGSSFRIIQDIGYSYNNYYFIEPSRHMLDKFLPTSSRYSDDKLKLICGTLESSRLCGDRPRIFVIVGVVRTIINLDEFLVDLRMKMNPGDILLLPLEPNNESFGYQTLTSKLSKIHRNSMGYVTRMVNWINRRMKSSSLNISEDPHPIVRALDDLIEKRIVSHDFTQEILYAVVNYHNFEWWRNLEIPIDSDEGFFTINGLASSLDASILQIDAFNFFQFRPITILGKYIECILKKAYPQMGAYFSAVLIKR